jgi:hypothetical protein
MNKGQYIIYLQDRIFLVNIIGNSLLKILNGIDFREFLKGNIVALTKEEIDALSTYNFNDKTSRKIFVIPLFEGIELPQSPLFIDYNELDPQKVTQDDINIWIKQFLVLKKEQLPLSYIKNRMQLDNGWSISITDFIFSLMEKYINNKEYDV